MVKLIISLTIVFAAIIPNTIGNEELPVAALEYLEALRPLAHKILELWNVCMHKSLDSESDDFMSSCIETGLKNDAKLLDMKNKSDGLKRTLSGKQLNEFNERTREIFDKAANELPPLALECIEDIKAWYSIIAEQGSKCGPKFTPYGGLDWTAYNRCEENGSLSQAGLPDLKVKCESATDALAPWQYTDMRKLVEKIEEEHELKFGSNR